MSCVPYTFYGLVINWCDWSWSWTFQEHSSVVCNALICVVYAVSVKLLQVWVASQKAYRPPSWLEPFRKVHNVSLAIVSGLMCVGMLYITVLDGRFRSWQTMACQMTPMVGLYGFVNFVYLISKLWEWVDTYLLVLTQKPVITLHWFHHMTTFTMAAVTHNFPVGGFAWINCLVHTVMYAHYARPVRWARPFITSGQLLQFVVVISIHVYGYLNPSTCYNMSPVFYEWLFCLFVVAGFFVMFSIFFVEEYLQKKGKKTGGSGAEKGSGDKKKKSS